MSLKQTAEIRTYENKDGETVFSDIILRNVQLSYASLVNTRPSLDGKKQQYTATLLIKDQAVADKYMEAYNQVYQEGLSKGLWGKSGPSINGFQVPFKGPDLDNDGKPKAFHEGVVLQIATTMNDNKQPQLFLRMPGQQLREAGEGDAEEFYSGAIVDAIIGLWPYGKSQATAFKEGIKPFLNSVCQVDAGTPFTGRDHKADAISAFGGSTDNLTAFAAPTATSVAPGVTPSAPQAAPSAPGLNTPQAPTTPPAPQAAPSAPGAPGLAPSQTVAPVQVTEAPAAPGTPTFEDILNQG